MNIVTAKTPKSFRVGATIFSLVLGLQAAWLLSAELLRPSLPFFPTELEIQDAAAQRERAADAARIGWFRGDLWADYALIADRMSLKDGTLPSANAKDETVSERALATAP